MEDLISASSSLDFAEALLSLGKPWPAPSTVTNQLRIAEVSSFEYYDGRDITLEEVLNLYALARELEAKRC